MGNFGSRHKSLQFSTKENIHAKQINEDNKKVTEAKKPLNLLILGALESGKSTLRKQLEILEQIHKTEESRRNYKPVVHSNTLESMMDMIKAMKSLNISYETPDRAEDAETIAIANAINLMHQRDFDRYDNQLVATREALKALWADGGIQKCFERSIEYQLYDSAKYYLDSLNRLFNPSYVPTEQDILRSRTKTTQKLEYKDLHLNLIDVGGARSERRKWVHAYENVIAIIFCVGMSEYDQVLYEDEKTNRMTESLKLFAKICNYPSFKQVPMMLFLNKIDLFKEKITKSPLNICFADYKGKNEYESASRFIREQFEKPNNYPDSKEICTHLICATDTENVRLVFNTVYDKLKTCILSDP